MTLAEKCVKLRKNCDWSQLWLAKLVGTNQTTISFIERGFVPPLWLSFRLEALFDKYYSGD